MKIGIPLKIYLLFLSLIFPALNAFSHEFTREIGGIQYELNTYDHTATVKGLYKNAPLKLIIPSEVEWKNEKFKVTTILSLQSLPYGAELIKPYSLTIPPTVTYIASFRSGGLYRENLDKLKEINLPDAPIYIDGYSFYENPSLEYIYIPPKVESINGSVFTKCENLRTVVIGSEHTFISGDAFFHNIMSTDKPTELKLIRLLSKTPPKYFSAFKHYIDSAILMVPPGTKASYQNSDWRYFDRIVEFDAELFNRYVPDYAKISSHKPSTPSSSHSPAHSSTHASLLASNSHRPSAISSSSFSPDLSFLESSASSSTPSPTPAFREGFNIMSFVYKDVIDEHGCTFVCIDGLDDITTVLKNNSFSLNRTFRAYLSEGGDKMTCKCYEYKLGGMLIKLYSPTETPHMVNQIFITFDTARERDIFLKNSLKAGMTSYGAQYLYQGSAESGIMARIEGNTIQIANDGIGYLDIVFPAPK